MTSFLKKKVRGVLVYDTYVIVDNYVEMGDFSICAVFSLKIFRCFLVNVCRKENS